MIDQIPVNNIQDFGW